jgi:hypothetical protein
MGEIDVAVEGFGNDEEDDLPALNETSTPVTQLGDLWLLGETSKTVDLDCSSAIQSWQALADVQSARWNRGITAYHLPQPTSATKSAPAPSKFAILSPPALRTIDQEIIHFLACLELRHHPPRLLPATGPSL